MKNLVGAILFFFILLFVYSKLGGPIPLSLVTTITSDTFSVSGEGKTTVSPDIAVVDVGVQAQGTTVKQVQNDLNTRINQVSDAVKKLGIKPEDIQTTNYSIFPQYDYQSPTQKITGYQASTNLTIKVRDIDRANEIIDAATQAGANQVGGITFDVDDKSKAENEAREKAVKDAKRKAQDAARIAGFKLGKVMNYSESFGPDGDPRPVIQKLEGAPGDQTVTQVEPGSSEIVVTVSLSYQIL